MRARHLIAAGIASLTLVIPVPAVANPIHADLDVAHTYWQVEPRDVNGNFCRNNWRVVADATLSQRNAAGEITLAWVHDDHNPTHRMPDAAGRNHDDGSSHGWRWVLPTCEFRMDPAFKGGVRRCVVMHEVGHAIHGPDHTGPMSVGLWTDCMRAAREHRTTAAMPRPRPRRTRAQIRRSLRFQHRQARIRARAAAARAR